MLQKLRSRHPIDLPDPAKSWGHKKGILAVMGSIAVLFLLLPLGVTLLSAFVSGGGLNVSGATAVAAGMGFLLVVLLVAGLRGKAGWDR